MFIFLKQPYTQPIPFSNVQPKYSWTFTNKSLSETNSGLNLFTGNIGNPSRNPIKFVPDRFCSLYNAIYLNTAYLQAPPDVYFAGDFTITAWVFFTNALDNTKIIDFGNDDTDNVYFGIKTTYPAGDPYTFSFNNSLNIMLTGQVNGPENTQLITSPIPQITPTSPTTQNWYFVSFVLDGAVAKIYVNGKIVNQKSMSSPKNIVRNKCLIGKGYLNNAYGIDIIYDDIKIYQSALSDTDIAYLYDKESTSEGKFEN